MERMKDYAHISELARKAAIMDRAVYAVFRKTDGTYSFGKYGTGEINGEIIELRHYL